MGLFDSVKGMKIGELKDKAAELAAKHEDKIEHGIDKAADFVDDRTGHKHSSKLDGGAAKLKDAVGRLGEGAHSEQDTPRHSDSEQHPGEGHDSKQ